MWILDDSWIRSCTVQLYETRTHDLRDMTKEALHGLAWTTDQIESRTPIDWLLLRQRFPLAWAGSDTIQSTVFSYWVHLPQMRAKLSHSLLGIPR